MNFVEGRSREIGTLSKDIVRGIQILQTVTSIHIFNNIIGYIGMTDIKIEQSIEIFYVRYIFQYRVRHDEYP